MSEPRDAERPIYHVPFSWESSHGHIVELLEQHATPGLIVDVGCGYAPHAERLTQRGFAYVGADASPDAVEHLRGRGFDADVVDADDPEGLLAVLDGLVAERDEPIAAVLALDVLEHLTRPQHVVAALHSWMRARNVALFGVSLPNASHADVGIKLLAGRYDRTPSGLLDHTHLQMCTNSNVTAMMTAAGFDELHRHDVESPRSDQEWPHGHPYLAYGTLVGSQLRRLRRLGDPHGGTFQFVRLFTPADRAPSPTLLAEVPEPPVAGLTVFVTDQCSDDDFAAITEQLAPGDARSSVMAVRRLLDDDAGRSGALADIETSYVAVVNGGERFDGQWASGLLARAAVYPGAVIRSRPLAGVAGSDTTWTDHFSLFEHTRTDATPAGALAWPTAHLRDVSEVWRAPGSLDVHALVLEAATLCGIIDAESGAVAVPPGWRRTDEVVAANVQHAADTFALIPLGGVRDIAAMMHDVQARLEALETENAELNLQLRRGPMRAAAAASRAAGRLKR